MKQLSKLLFSLMLAFSLVLTSIPQVSVHASKMIDGYEYTDEQVKGLEVLNIWRTNLGLPKVSMNYDLTQAAVGHSKYLYVNDEIEHIQTKSLFFTGKDLSERVVKVGGTRFYERNKLNGLGEVISYRSPLYGVEDLLIVPYHRNILIDPRVVLVGIGSVMFHNTVINVGYRGEIPSSYDTTPLLFPYNGQKNVPTHMYLNENPNPFEGTGLTREKAGLPLSATFASNVRSSDFTYSLTDSKGKEVSIIVKGSTNDKNEETNFWLFIPKSPLVKGETYTFKVNNSTSIFTVDSTMSDWKYKGARESEFERYTAGMDLDKKYEKPLSKYTISEYKAYRDKLIPKKFANKGFSANNVGINLNGEYLKLSSPAKVINGTTFVPLRGVVEKLGGRVKWYSDMNLVEVRGDYYNEGFVKVEVLVGFKSVTVYKPQANIEVIELTAKPFIEKGVTYVPLRVISEALGASVRWDASTYTVGIGF